MDSVALIWKLQELSKGIKILNRDLDRAREIRSEDSIRQIKDVINRYEMERKDISQALQNAVDRSLQEEL
jgi:hypothetical protein